MFLGVFRVFRHSSPFVAQALPLPLCVIMGDELAAEIEYSKNKCDPSIGVFGHLSFSPLPRPSPPHPPPPQPHSNIFR